MTARPVALLLLAGCAAGGGDTLGVCPDMLACAAAVAPDTVADLTAAYGKGGTCWKQAGGDDQTCRDTCASTIDTWAFSTASACPAAWVPTGTFELEETVIESTCDNVAEGESFRSEITLELSGVAPIVEIEAVATENALPIAVELACTLGWDGICEGDGATIRGEDVPGERSYVLADAGDGTATWTLELEQPSGCRVTTEGAVGR